MPTMCNRRADRLAIVTMIVGFLIGMYAQCPTRSAHANPPSLEPGERCLTKPVKVKSFVVSRKSLVRSLATEKSERRCAGYLGECAKRVARAAKPEPGWKIAGRWFLTGTAVTIAFIVGLTL